MNNLQRALWVLGAATLVAGVNCITGASGYHGWGARYYTTPLDECLTHGFPIVFVVVAIFALWITRQR